MTRLKVGDIYFNHRDNTFVRVLFTQSTHTVTYTHIDSVYGWEYLSEYYSFLRNIRECTELERLLWG